MSGPPERVSVAGAWWRHAAAGLDPWARPRDPFDGRWQRGAAVDALYFAESPETAWAEWYRYLAEAGMPPALGLPRELWRWEVEVEEIADLQSAQTLEALGLDAMRPSRSQWPECQQVGEALFAAGCRALIAPSAARPELGRVLCVFRTEARVEGLRPVPPPERHEHPPPLPRGLRT